VKTVVLRVAKAKCRWADTAVNDYLQRLGRQFPVQEHVLRPAKSSLPINQRRHLEKEGILSFLRPGDRLVVLDERGETPDTEGLKDWMQGSMNQGVKRLVFAIGGPFGHDPTIHQDSWKTLALSKMVLNHELARVMLAEQLYRVYTLMYGGDYHH
jgi:23S rRNA (pseudouridine1915-N3)-methyltransferase